MTEGAGATDVPRWRRWTRVGVTILACVLITVSAVGMWTRAVLLDTSVYIATVDDIPSQEAVAAALSDYLTQEVFDALGVEKRVADLLPDEAQPLATPLTAAVQSYIQGQVETFLLSNKFNDLWVDINTVAHEKVVKVLRGGGGDILSTSDGEVTLNLIPLINQILVELNDAAQGFFGYSGDAPQITSDMVPDDMRSELESAFGIDLPDDFGEIVIFQSDELGAVQDAVRFFDDFVFVLGVLSVAAIAGAIALATDRRGAVLRLSVGVAIGFFVLLQATNAITAEIAKIPSTQEGQDAARAVADTSTRLFVEALRLIGIIGLLVALVLWYVGPGERAARVRHRLGSLIARTETGRNIGTWIVEHVDALRLGGIALVFILLWLFDIRNWLGLAAIFAIVAAYEFALGFVRRGAQESDGGDDQVSGDGSDERSDDGSDDEASADPSTSANDAASASSS